MSWEGWSRRSLSWLLIVSLAFNVGVGVTLGALAYRKHSAPDRGSGYGKGGHRFGSLEELNLTPDQHTRLEAAREEMLNGIHELRLELKKEQEALTELMVAPEPDRQAIAEQLGSIASRREQMEQQVVDHFLGIKQALEPQQHEAYNQMIRRAFSRHGHGRGGYGGPGGPYKGHRRGKRGPPHGGNDQSSQTRQGETR